MNPFPFRQKSPFKYYARGAFHAARWPLQICIFPTGGDDVRKFEPKTWLKFKDIDESIRELRAIFKQHPQWFEVPKPKSDKGKSEVDYSI